MVREITIPKLFKTGTTRLNVVLNFAERPRQEFGIQSGAYHRAAQVLVAHFTDQNGFNDFDGCPIAFLY